MSRNRIYVLLLACLSFVIIPATAEAALYSFTNITNNNPIDAGIGEAQLSLNVTDAGDGNALFTFSNTGPEPSSITGIYIDGCILAGIETIMNTSGLVEFRAKPKPKNLPGGNALDPNFDADVDLSLDSDSPVMHNGINPNESLGVLYNIRQGTFADLLGDLNDNSLRVGLHVQAFADGGSESFVHDNSSLPVPEPSSLLLLLGCMMWFVRKR